ncbi:MAG: malate dehydrogenase [Phycisphaeraceae bacterium]|nr:malate dehydrogenase [Phycisphaerae bacterium]MBX3392118.1 malate dehydrogenase [Phycisphaeraceae bacterium]HRJ50951.1 malate dehydrogenase [Phycisphaerales bacterium]
MRRAKISIIGAGNIGGTCAHWAASKELGDIVLLDIPIKDKAELHMPRGKALDLACCGPIENFDCRVTGTFDYADIAGSDVVVITAGLPRKPGMSRDDLVQVNAGIVRNVSEQVKKFAPDSVVIVVSNPLDAMVYVAWKTTGFPAHRVIGQAGALDVARYKTFLAMELGVSVEDIQGLLLGGHGDDMVPLPRLTSVNGIPISDLLSAERIQACVDRAKVGGGEIVKLMGTSAFYAPASGTIEMVEAIVRDKKRVIPCAAWCEDEFGVKSANGGKGLFVGVPCVLGTRGVEKVLTFSMNAEEKKFMDESISHVKDLIAATVKIFPDLA